MSGPARNISAHTRPHVGGNMGHRERLKEACVAQGVGAEDAGVGRGQPLRALSNEKPLEDFES